MTKKLPMKPKQKPLDLVLATIEERGGSVDRSLLLEILIQNGLTIVRRPRKDAHGQTEETNV